MSNSETNIHLRTPLVLSQELSKLNEGTNVYLKLDNLQPSGSFKIRGVGYMAVEKQKSELANHLICSSGGNAGLATAYVGQKLGIKATIVTPVTVLPSVVDKLKFYGANVVIHGRAWDEANEKAIELLDQSTNSVFVPPFDHELIWKGNASIVDEIREDMADVVPDCIIASVGGGGLVCGIMQGVVNNRWIDKDVTVIAVETTGADSFYQSVLANKLITLDEITSIAKSLGAKRVATQLFDYKQLYGDKLQSVAVSDRDVVETMCKFLEQHKMLVEPGCAASLCVAYNMAKYLPGRSFRNIVVEVCGGSAVTLQSLLNYKRDFAVE